MWVRTSILDASIRRLLSLHERQRMTWRGEKKEKNTRRLLASHNLLRRDGRDLLVWGDHPSQCLSRSLPHPLLFFSPFYSIASQAHSHTHGESALMPSSFVSLSLPLCCICLISVSLSTNALSLSLSLQMNWCGNKKSSSSFSSSSPSVTTLPCPSHAWLTLTERRRRRCLCLLFVERKRDPRC